MSTKLVERATDDSVKPALIQNGSTPDDYTKEGSKLVKKVAKNIAKGSAPKTSS